MTTENETIAREVSANQASMPLPTDHFINPEAIIKKTEALITAMDAMIKMSLRRTNPSDWGKFGDNYWLGDSGAMKVRNIWGIYFENQNIVGERKEDGSKVFIATGECGSSHFDKWYGQKVTIPCYGSRSTSDPFFGKNPDEEDVKKAALANMRARGVCDVLGLKNLSEADLKIAGVDTAKIQNIDFKTGSKGGAVASDEDKLSQTKLYNLLVKICNSSDEKILAGTLKSLTKFKGRDGKEVPGVDSIKSLAGKRLSITLEKAQQMAGQVAESIDIDEPGAGG